MKLKSWLTKLCEITLALIQLGINKGTVEHYLDLLTKVFIIYSLGGYGGNLRKEVVKTKKWYFFDNGIRNAIINDFKPLQSRNDTGMLWEQYILSERQKKTTTVFTFPNIFSGVLMTSRKLIFWK